MGEGHPRKRCSGLRRCQGRGCRRGRSFRRCGSARDQPDLARRAASGCEFDNGAAPAKPVQVAAVEMGSAPNTIAACATMVSVGEVAIVGAGADQAAVVAFLRRRFRDVDRPSDDVPTRSRADDRPGTACTATMLAAEPMLPSLPCDRCRPHGRATSAIQPLPQLTGAPPGDHRAHPRSLPEQRCPSPPELRSIQVSGGDCQRLAVQLRARRTSPASR